MTCNFTRTTLALALALGLAGCGGKATFPISGTVLGLAYNGLVLSSNGMDLPIAAGSTSFSFPSTLSYGDVYAVTVASSTAQPLHQTCQVVNGSDTAGRLASINVGIVCALNQRSITARINGLTTDGLILTNGSAGGTVAPPMGTTSATFGTLVPYSITYGVTVLQQPAGFTCIVAANGTGTMGDDPVTIDVDCNTPA